MYDDQDRIQVRNAAVAVTALGWALLIRSGPHAHHHTSNQSANWLLMLTAMMAPVLIEPLQFVRGSSLRRHRTRSTLLFIAGYTSVWMLAGAVLLPLAATLKTSGFLAVLCIALVWQCSPAKQVCLNRCHALINDTGPLRFGASQGIWCAGSCWAWMLLPLLAANGHLWAMAAAAILIFCERLDNPAPLRWRWRGLGKASRIVVGQMKIRLRNPAPAGNY